MDATTARSELLGRMPELHRLFRERISEIDDDDDESCRGLTIDFLVLAIWMFGDRQLVVDHFEKFTGETVIICDGIHDWLTDDLCIVIRSVEGDKWLECLESMADSLRLDEEALSFYLVIRCERTMQLVNVVLDRVEIIRGVDISVHGFDPSPASTEKFIQVLDRSSPLDYLFLDDITDRLDFWSEILKYAFQKPPDNQLGLEVARDSRMVTTLAAMRCTTTLVPSVCLRNSTIDDELFSLLLTMPFSSLCFDESSRIRGDFSTAADALARNTTLKDLVVECDEVCSSFTEVLSNGLANNATLERLEVMSAIPFPALCRGVGRNGAMLRADLCVSSLMDEACMYELAQNSSLQKLFLTVCSGAGSFSWSATATFLRNNQSMMNLGITDWTEGNDPSGDELRMIGRSLAGHASLETFELKSHSRILTWNGCAELLSGLGCNTTLRSFTIEGPEMLPSRRALEHVMERNYGLESVVVMKSGATPMIETICTLNAAGRKYMLVDPTSREKGVDVLSRVINNLDCVYYHLRENPSFCNLNEHLHAVPTSLSKSRKRRRCPDSTADQFVGAPSSSSLLRRPETARSGREPKQRLSLALTWCSANYSARP